MAARVLIVDERGTFPEPVFAALQRHFRVARVSALEQSPPQPFDVCLIGPGCTDEAEVCTSVLGSGVAEEVVILGSSPSLDDTIRAIRARASDFIPDGADADAVI